MTKPNYDQFTSQGYIGVARLNNALHTTGELRPYEQLIAIHQEGDDKGITFYVKNTHPSHGRPIR